MQIEGVRVFANDAPLLEMQMEGVRVFAADAPFLEMQMEGAGVRKALLLGAITNNSATAMAAPFDIL